MLEQDAGEVRYPCVRSLEWRDTIMHHLQDPRPVHLEAIYVQALGKEYEGDDRCIHCRGLSAIGKPIDPRGPFIIRLGNRSSGFTQ